MTQQGEIIVAVKHAVKDRYAWPGGYPLYLVTEDGNGLCVKCGKENLGLIVAATATRDRSGWAVAAVDVNWEDPDLLCAHCGQGIESAYA